MSEDLERGRPVDCVRSDTMADAGDVNITLDGLAWSGWKKPFRDLTRGQQRMIKSVFEGNRREIRDQLKAIQDCTALDAVERIQRTGEMGDRLAVLMENLVAGAEELMHDNMEVTVNPAFPKTRAGTLRRNLRHVHAVERVRNLHIKTDILIAKLHEREAAQVSFTKNDNRQITVTPEEVKSRLSRFGGKSVVEVGDIGQGEGEQCGSGWDRGDTGPGGEDADNPA